MVYYKEIVLKNGQPCILRRPTVDDAEHILEHMLKTSSETNHVGRYADEITMTVEQEQQHIAKLADNKKSIMIAAVIDGIIVANASVNPVSNYERRKHRGDFGIAVIKEYWGMGIGTAVLEAIIEAAKSVGYEQLELEVVSDNEPAVSLYRKCGFKIYGTRENSFRYRDGSYSDGYLMLLKL